MAATSACTLGPNFHATVPWAPVAWQPSVPPAEKTPSVAVADKIDPAWWALFHDPELTSLEDRVAADNLNVRLATIRLLESRAQRRVTGADQMPTLDADGSYTRQGLSQKGVLSLFGGSSTGESFASNGSSANGVSGRTGGIPSSVTGGKAIPPFDLFQGGFDASWELDIWGRVRREVEGADANLEASGDARRDALLSELAEVARDYVQLRGQQTQLRITEENIESERDSLKLTQARYRGGLATDLDVSNAAADLASTRAQPPQIKQQIAASINALSLLLGEAPGALSAELIQPHAVPPVPDLVPIGVPSELARRRPDIREAEAQLHAATADVGVATADFYPQIKLDGSDGLQALQFKNLGSWSSNQYGIGPTISLPIFEGGRLRGTLALRQAQQQEAALQYQQTVLSAWHEVDNALIAYSAEQSRHDALAEAVRQSQHALDLSRQRYRQGVSDFLEVLDAQRTVLSAELALASSSVTVSQNMVALYKALGGGWETSYPVASK